MSSDKTDSQIIAAFAAGFDASVLDDEHVRQCGRALVDTMAVAIAKVHGPKGFFVQDGGYEYNLVLIIAALAVAAMGPGRFSLDYLLGLTR